MIDRRQFVAGAGAACTLGVALPFSALGQGRRVFRLGNPANVNDAQQCFITCGRHPRLGYYEVEGVDVEYVNMSNVSQSMQTVVMGETNFATVQPIVYFGAIAKEPGLGLIAVYNFLPRNAGTLCVKPDSPYNGVADLKGKRIGIRNAGDAGTLLVKLMLKESGLDDGDTTFVSVGDSGPAGTALYQDRVDALVGFDTASARVELAGFPLRYLPLTRGIARTSAAWFGVSQKDLKEHRKQYVGLFRGIAKSTLFARANLDQAINLHWALYPESRPKSKSDEDGRAEVKTILGRRKDNWMRREDDPDKRMGAIAPEDAKASLALAGEVTKDPKLASKVGDLDRWVSNELIDEVNAFDHDAVVKQAKAFVL